MKVQVLDKKQHNRKKFDCGTPALNQYLKQTARQHDSLDVSRTSVLVEDSAPSEIIGFYTLSVCHIKWPDLPDDFQKKYPEMGVSAALIGRLAIDHRHQGQGWGSFLLMDAIDTIIRSGDRLPLPVIVVDAKDDKAKTFYMAFGFNVIAPGSNRLFMPTKHAKEMLDSV